MDWVTAFMLGFAGSLHCAGMCGPLVMALPAVGCTRLSQMTGRLVYNVGRVATYVLLGVLFGGLGELLGLMGFQRWLSMGAGAVILIALVAWPFKSSSGAIARPVVRLKSALGQLIQRRSAGSHFLFGSVNGLLPCGLVYVACAGAAATGGVVSGGRYMLVFGLGTVPMMFGLGLAGRFLHRHIQGRVQHVIPVALAAMAVLLILRGMSLGIPFLSPVVNAGDPSCTCH